MVAVKSWYHQRASRSFSRLVCRSLDKKRSHCLTLTAIRITSRQRNRSQRLAQPIVKRGEVNLNLETWPEVIQQDFLLINTFLCRWFWVPVIRGLLYVEVALKSMARNEATEIPARKRTDYSGPTIFENHVRRRQHVAYLALAIVV